MLVAADDRARGFHGVFNEVDASNAWNNGDSQAEGTTATADQGMQMAFNLGTIAAGASETFTYAYNLAPDVDALLDTLNPPGVDIDLADHFDDVDLGDTPAGLIYTAEVAGGAPLPTWLSIDGTHLVGFVPTDTPFTMNVVITATDSYGASATDTVSITVAGAAPPVVVDLDGDGVEFSSLRDGIQFDVDGDGALEQTAWAGRDDAVLVYDHDQDGDVTDRSEIAFADYAEADGATDLEGLQSFDSNEDGSLDAGDAEFSKFGLWQDADGDGVVGDGELTSLTEAGVESIELTSDGVGYTAAGGDVQVHGEALVHLADGTTAAAADAEFAYVELALNGDPEIQALGASAGQAADTAQDVGSQTVIEGVDLSGLVDDGTAAIEVDAETGDTIVIEQPAAGTPAPQPTESSAPALAPVASVEDDAAAAAAAIAA